MPRYEFQTISGKSAWDAIIDDAMGAMNTGTTLVGRFANAAALPDADQNEHCLALTQDDQELWLSKDVGGGWAWRQVTVTLVGP
jgi:hypothetical protein